MKRITRITCTGLATLERLSAPSYPWGFGTILKLEPGHPINIGANAVDRARRWMLLDAGQPWAAVRLDNMAVVNLPSLVGLSVVETIRVDE